MRHGIFWAVVIPAAIFASLAGVASYFVAPIAAEQPEQATEQGSAAELLARARAARAVWDDFPGFTADAVVHIDRQAGRGRIEVAADGNIQWRGFDKLDLSWAQEQMASLVAHRLPDLPSPADAAAFVEKERRHALGPLIRPKQDRMGGSYRVRDGVITEVSRDLGKARFTISVLEIERNAADEYLPRVFTVTFWDQAGSLVRSETYSNRWRQVEDFDLPERLTVVSSDQKGRRVMRIELSDHRLGNTAAAGGQE